MDLIQAGKFRVDFLAIGGPAANQHIIIIHLVEWWTYNCDFVRFWRFDVGFQNRLMARSCHTWYFLTVFRKAKAVLVIDIHSSGECILTPACLESSTVTITSKSDQGFSTALLNKYLWAKTTIFPSFREVKYSKHARHSLNALLRCM
jgi:hypothetical protein